MGNMDVHDRSQYERSDLGTVKGQRLFEVKSKRGLIITNVLLIIVAVGLSIAAVSAVDDGWADWAVLGAIVMTTIGLIIAINTRMN